MSKHKLTLLGGPHAELRVPASVLLEALSALVEGARLATRFAVEGESVRKGPRPTWLDAACDFDITGLTQGSAVIEIESKSLFEVDQARFGSASQFNFFLNKEYQFGKNSALDIFGIFLGSAIESARDDIVADRPLLESYARFARIARGAFFGVRLEGMRGRTAALEVTLREAERIERLRDETPRPQAARVTGILDTISASRSDIMLALHDGTRIPARMEQHNLEILRPMLGAEVVVSGVAHYRPSGRLLLIDVESLDVARVEDTIFRSAPTPRRSRLMMDADAPTDTGGITSFFGAWPGGETDDDLLAALRAIA